MLAGTGKAGVTVFAVNYRRLSRGILRKSVLRDIETIQRELPVELLLTHA